MMLLQQTTKDLGRGGYEDMQTTSLVYLPQSVRTFCNHFMKTNHAHHYDSYCLLVRPIDVFSLNVGMRQHRTNSMIMKYLTLRRLLLRAS